MTKALYLKLKAEKGEIKGLKEIKEFIINFYVNKLLVIRLNVL